MTPNGGAGHLVEARVLTLTTRFKYTSASLSAGNGLGARLAVEVVGHGTTTGKSQGRFPGIPSGSSGLGAAQTAKVHFALRRNVPDCLGELAGGGWLYYLADGLGYVRQGTDEQGQVVNVPTPARVPALGGLFDPDG